MTKQQEIEAIRGFIATLPVDSYIRPWLDNVLPEVESEIRNDFMVSPSLRATRLQCDALLADTQAQCQEMLAKAKAQFERIMKTTNDESQRVRDRLAGDLRSALRTMES